MKKAVVGLAVCMFGMISHAEQIFYEPFDYPVGGSIGGMNGGSGFTGKWRDLSGAKGDAFVAWSGLSFSDMPVSGSSLLMDMSKNKASEGINIVRILGRELKEGTLWVSFLYEYDGEQKASFIKDIMAFIRFQSSSDKSIRFRMMCNVLDGGGVGVRQSGAAGNEGSCKETSIATGNTYLIVCAFPKLGEAEGGAPVIWALNEENYNNLRGKGSEVTGNDLSENSVASAKGASAVADLKKDDSIILGLWARKENAGFSVSFDELRAGTELTDVLVFR